MAIAVSGDADNPRVRRIVGFIVAIAATGVLGLAAWLEPAEKGLGTHESLGLPPCGWIMTMDIPCPTCGMTTSFSHATNGDLLQSFLVQPLGMLLAIGTAMTMLIGYYVGLSGSRLGSALARLWGRRSGWILAGLFVAAWGYKVLVHKGII